MDSSLHEVWQAAAGSPFYPAINKGSQFWISFLLLVLGIFLTGAFALSMFTRPFLALLCSPSDHPADRSLINVPVLGIPASLAIAYAPLSTIALPIMALTFAGSEWFTCSVLSESTSKIPPQKSRSIGFLYTSWTKQEKAPLSVVVFLPVLDIFPSRNSHSFSIQFAPY